MIAKYVQWALGGHTMTWSSWKPADRRRPSGNWRQYQMSTAVVGITHRRAAVVSFMKGAFASDQNGDDWAVELERESTNKYHANAIAVYGRWTERRKRWFRPEAVEVRRAHIGYLNSDLADRFAEKGSDFPLAAELYDVRVNDSNDAPELLGVILKINILLPSKTDPQWAHLDL